MNQWKPLWRRYSPKRPSTDKLGMSRSEFKRKLKMSGHSLKRDFWIERVSRKDGRMYRWHFDDLEVDVSCHVDDFDRWANSTECTVSFESIIAQGNSNDQTTQQTILD